MRAAGCLVIALLLASQAVAQEHARTIHVFVALCDNQHQGIVPVPAKLGNGEDPANNLYWGALYGVKTFFKNSKSWTLVTTEKTPGDPLLERVIFKHVTSGTYVVADAYRGDKIKNAVADFLNAAAGNNAGTLKLDKASLGVRGSADLVAYVGHNGLMDFTVDQPIPQTNVVPKDAIVLACKSKPYFLPCLSQLKCRSVLLTTGLMAPEAYTLDAAMTGWIEKEPPDKIINRAARAYNNHQ
ncbi:MAG: hypothetical protein JW955_01140 [Sedimentisphaerales bacterium]|nr:hypothetical protein [Sedimentisphaerales bacterium]